MFGFSIIISKNKELPFSEFKWKKPFDFQPEFIKRKFLSNGILFEQFTLKNLANEKLWVDTSEFFIVTEGVITNLKALTEEFKAKDYTTLLLHLIKEKTFFNKFKGHFSGFIYYKKTGNCFAFNNHTGSKKLFYFSNSDYLLFGSDLYTLHEALKSLKIKTTPDIEAAYLLLSSGFMMSDFTLIKEIKQICAGQYAKLIDNNITIDSYFHLSEISENSLNKKDIIEKIDYLFQKAIQYEYSIDENYKLNSISTLSGGLDSRMTTLIAHKLGFNQTCLNFSEMGYADQIIANEISDKYKLKLHFVPLKADSLINIDKVILVNDGLTIYTGASHVFEALKNLNIQNTGLIHTGILGDAIFGSYLRKKEIEAPDINNGSYSMLMSIKTASLKRKIAADYTSDEVFKFYTRGFHGINNGFLYFDLLGETTSAFLEPEFLKFVLSIPREFRIKECIYIDWIHNLQPTCGDFIWENQGGKPTNNEILRSFYRYKRAIIKRLPFKSMWKNNMNPEQLWYDKNPNVKQYLDTYYQNHLYLADFNKELLTDLTKMYNTGTITEKTQVLTLLAAYKLHFT